MRYFELFTSHMGDGQSIKIFRDSFQKIIDILFKQIQDISFINEIILLQSLCILCLLFLLRDKNNLSYFFYFQVTISLHVFQAEKEQKLVVKEPGSASDAGTVASFTDFRLVSFVIPSLVLLTILRLLQNLQRKPLL